MNSFIKGCVFFLFIFLEFNVFSQSPNVKLEGISISDLEMKVYKPDPGADAVVLYDCGLAEVVLVGGDLQIELQRVVRVKIINKSGFDYANVEIPFGIDDKVFNVEATTYNIENGIIKEAKVPRKSFILEKTNKYQRIFRIAFPNVYEGSIIEYKYTYQTSALYEFIPWKFQDKIPIKYIEFTAKFPDFFNYRGLIKGDLAKIEKRYESYNIYFGGYSTVMHAHKWMGENIPSFVEEPYITGVKDLLLRLDFELIGVNFPNSSYKELTPTYEKLSQRLLDRSDFGLQLYDSYFLSKITKNVIKGLKDNSDKLTAIHRYVSNEIIWNGVESYTSTKSLKAVIREKRGNSAEINMILIAMLRYAGITADPVILSTRSNGALHPIYAMYQKFNYLVASVYIAGKDVLVDATNPLLPYNTLPFECLNNEGWIVHPSLYGWIKLNNNEKKSSREVYSLLLNQNGTFEGGVNHTYYYYDAYDIRRFIKLESEEGYVDYLKSKYSNADLSNISIGNIDSLKRPINIAFNANFKFGIQNTSSGFVLDLFSMIGENSKNVFFPEERKFPIDFGCPIDRTISFNITLPHNYIVENIPEKVTIKLPNDWGVYIYSCQFRDNILVVDSYINIKEIRYKSEDYKMLRDWFSKIIKKHSEVIVVNKIS